MRRKSSAVTDWCSVILIKVVFIKYLKKPPFRLTIVPRFWSYLPKLSVQLVDRGQGLVARAATY